MDGRHVGISRIDRLLEIEDSSFIKVMRDTIIRELGSSLIREYNHRIYEEDCEPGLCLGHVVISEPLYYEDQYYLPIKYTYEI